MSETLSQQDLFKCAVELAAAYLRNNSVPLEGVPAVVTRMHQILADTNRNPHMLRKSLPSTPAVAIEDSITDEFIVCLEDGKKLQMLKRHLKTMYNMSVDQYKERWGLPLDYPVVAPKYARRRSEIAKTTGLGLTGRRGRKGLKSVSVDGQMGVVATGTR